MADLNGDVAGQEAAKAYAEALEQQANMIPQSIEVFASSLKAGGVGDDVVAKFEAIPDHAQALAAGAKEGADVLRSHDQVADAYHATGDQAGDKEFITR